MQSDFEQFFWFAVVVLVVAGVPSALYVLVVWNNFTSRLTRLKRLVADLRSIRARRRGVAADVGSHVRRAADHERRIASRGARINKGCGRAISFSHIGAAWPNTSAVGTVEQGLGINVNSRDAENLAQLALNREAEQYNALLWSFPRGRVAQRLGFRPWRIAVPASVARNVHTWRRSRGQSRRNTPSGHSRKRRGR